MSTADSFGAKGVLDVAGAHYEIFRLSAVEGSENLPFSLKVLLENLLRTEDGANITADHVRALAQWDAAAEPDTEIQFTLARVIMQDFTGVPCVVDLATMREAVADLGGDPKRVNPLAPAEMVIDHSVQIDAFGNAGALERNMEIEYQRNGERYQFLRWGQTAFDDFKVVPPGMGIVHQVNLEYLARTVMTREVDGVVRAYPDTCVGTDSHTTMVNGLGVLGWGVGGIEAEAAMLGQPVSMLIPRVVGFKLTGDIPAGATATDVVLTITQMLRKHGVVGKFVEFYGDGVASVPLANRATIGNMSPEFGSTAAMFPIDAVTLDYLRLTGRPAENVALVEAYAKEQGLWHDPSREIRFSEYLELDLSTVVPSIAGPKRPQDRVELSKSQGPVPRGPAQLLQRPRPGLRPGRHRGRVLPGELPRVRLTELHARDDVVRHGRELRAPRDRRRRSRPVHASVQEGHREHEGRPRVRTGPRRREHRVDHVLHEHVQPVGHARRRRAGAQRRREGPRVQAVGQDLRGAGLEGRHGLLREVGPDPVPREARVLHGRLRLRHLHRQLRSAGGRDLAGDPGQRPRRDGRPVGQPQLRGPDQPRTSR
ncbi:hypothetical protein MN0502_06290 [Arthrobacter sp. MN05-02]|nr:hypothetical protein MN0502_06290 [Arthrobacter sp. MN05-02]